MRRSTPTITAASAARAAVVPPGMAPSIARSSVTSTPSKPSSRRESRIASGERPAGRSGFIRVHQVTNHDHRHLGLDGHSKTRQVPLYNGLHIVVDTKPFKMGTFEAIAITYSPRSTSAVR